MGEDSTVAESHNLNPDTMRMVEQAIKSLQDLETAAELYEALPRAVQYATFMKIPRRLEESNKIGYGRNGAVFWIFAENKPGLADLQMKSIRLK